MRGWLRGYRVWLLIPVVIAAGVGFGLGLSSWIREPASASPPPLAAQEVVQGEIEAVLEQGEVTLGEHTQTYQVLAVRILEGAHQGEIAQVERGRRLLLNDPQPLRAGDRLLISFEQGPSGEAFANLWDIVRIRPLSLLFGVFVAVTLLVSGWKGARSLVGMGLSLAVIVAFILPQILAGHDPVLVSVAGSAFLLATSLYLVHGWGVKTHSAVLGTLAALLLTALMADIFLSLTHLTGFGSEEAVFVTQIEGTAIQVRGLLLGGIIIGTLGVLDDLSISQAAAIQELHLADPGLRWARLFEKGMNIGRDHIAATVNTLVLAYVGASLPLLLLFHISDQPALFLLSRETMAEEVVRTLVGSLGLIAAVPLTTALAAWLVGRRSNR